MKGKLILLFGWILLNVAPLLAVPKLNYAPARPRIPVARNEIAVAAQSGGACGAGVAHCTALSWAATTSTCSTPCTIGYNVFRGTAAGSESATPLNAAPLSGTSYIDPVTLTSSAQTFFYIVQAVETSGSVVASSGPSNEASATFPGIPAAPSSLGATPH